MSTAFDVSASTRVETEAEVESAALDANVVIEELPAFELALIQSHSENEH